MCEVAHAYLRGRAAVSTVIKETCNALWDVLSPIYMTPPTPAQWELIKQQFYESFVIFNFMIIVLIFIL